MAAVTIYRDFGAQVNKVCHYFHCFCIYLPWSDRTGCHDLSFLNPGFQVSSFTLLFYLHQESLYLLLTSCHKQDSMEPFQDKASSPMPFACLLPVEKFSLLSHPQVLKDKFNQKWENAERKENSQVRQNNDSLAIKQNQGHLIPLQGLQKIHWAMTFELFFKYWKPHRWKNLTVCCPEALKPQTGKNQKVDDVD